MDSTYFKCEQCQQSGEVTHDKHAGVMEVYYLVMDSHSSLNPDCNGGRWDIRVSLEPIEDKITGECPKCGSEKADFVSESSGNGEQNLCIIACQCPNCGEETVTYPQFPDYSGF